MLQKLDVLFESRKTAWFFAFLFLAAGLILCFVANGTCDDGDSIMHYQFARWALVHHDLFFHHWAKPLYVLIACPFAQFGIPGIKIFNLLVSTFTILITFSIAGILSVPRRAVVALFMVMSPALITHSLSGLTEPLFALVLSLSVLLYLRDKYILSVVLISFLPFVRSEGLIICGVFAILLVIEHNWRLLPLLLLGHLVYGILGAPYHHQHGVLWVFTSIPYARLSSVYGHGYWHDFFVRLPLITGLPLCVLLFTGLLAMAFHVLKQWNDKSARRKIILIYGSFLCYFSGHVIFWKFGIFNSLGLMRVLIGVLPMMAIIEMDGFNAILPLISSLRIQTVVSVVILLLIVIFPFTGVESAWHYERDFCLQTTQKCEKMLTDYIKANYQDYKTAQYYFDANYFSILLDMDYFDDSVSHRVWEEYKYPPTRKAFILWDDYYSKVECNTALDVPKNNPSFQYVKDFSLVEPWRYEKTVVLFKTKDK